MIGNNLTHQYTTNCQFGKRMACAFMVLAIDKVTLNFVAKSKLKNRAQVNEYLINTQWLN